MSPLATGSQLARYRIVRPLGAGAMGEVYLAEDPQIERKLAIKTVRIEEGKPNEIEERKRRLLREARAAGRLMHPNIVALFDAGEDQGVLFLAFEYVAGADLSQRLDEGPPLSLGEALGLIRQAAEGLGFAHQQGIVHRDIKPSNLLITRDGQLKIADFGIAKMTDQTSELTMTGSVVGSPHYLSPEQIRGEELDGRSDVFSLGVVLYELLTRRKPFNGETLTTLVYQILHQEPTALVLRRADLAPRLESLVRRMLAKDRAQRFASAREVSAEIGRLERELDPAVLGSPAAPGDDADELQATLHMPSTPPPPPGSGPFAAPLPPGAPPTPQPLLASPRTASTSSRKRGTMIAVLAAAAVVLLVGGGLLGKAWLSGRPPAPQAGQEGGPAVVPPATAEPPATQVPPPRAVVVERPTPPTFGGVATPETTPEPIPTFVAPRPTGPPRPTPSPTAVPTPEPTAEPEPTRPQVQVDRELESGMALSFQVLPEDSFVIVDRTPIGQAVEWNAKKKEGRAYQLPDAGDHIVKIRKEGMREVTLRVKAQAGRAGVTTIAVNMSASGSAGGAVASSDARRRLRVSEGVNLKIEPEEADVEVDGRRVGSAREFRGSFGRKGLQPGPGEHRVVISAPGYVAIELTVEVTPGAADRRQTVDARLARQ